MAHAARERTSALVHAAPSKAKALAKRGREVGKESFKSLAENEGVSLGTHAALTLADHAKPEGITIPIVNVKVAPSTLGVVASLAGMILIPKKWGMFLRGARNAFKGSIHRKLAALLESRRAANAAQTSGASDY